MSVRVVFVAGTGRSGSTVFELALAQHLGVPSTGELVTVFRRGVLEDRNCSCGDRFSVCPFWKSVVAADPAAFTHASAERVDASMSRVLRAFGLLRCLTGSSRSRLARIVDPQWFRAMGSLYKAVGTVTGTPVFTDSSKAPALALLLDRIEGVDIDLVHLVRDPRSVGRSWQHPHPVPEGTAPMPTLDPWRSALVWSMVNEAAHRVGRALRGRCATVRYEDFVTDPQAVLSSVAGQLDLAGASTRQGPLEVTPAAHTMSGNPSVRLRRERFTVSTEPPPITARWDLSEMMTVVMTWPERRRYRYGLRADGRFHPDHPLAR